ncbi:MAG TPA: amidohydrolase [Bryobacteraceae bacterium]|nr:amidohydrolase [Bryobacteraceae bacterium]
MFTLLRAAAVLVIPGVFALAQDGRTADLILRHGAIYTMDAPRRWVESVAVANGRIIFAGPDAGAVRLACPSTKVVDLGGKMVLPGFHDSHVHLMEGGLDMSLCDVKSVATPLEVLAAVRKFAAAHPDKPWVTGSGWDLPVFPDANPRKQQLDEAVGDRPAYIESADGHSGWANSKALSLAGITRDTPDPVGGRIERDPVTKEPTGTLRESARELVTSKIPAPTAEQNTAGLKRAVEFANSLGIVSVQEADASDEILNAYRDLESRGQLTLRVVAALRTDPRKSDEQVAGLIERRAKFSGQRMRATAAKIFADGVIESGTAALLDPYLNRGGSRGELNFEPDRLAKLVTRLDREGFQVHIHAIGDRAIRVSLDAHEAAQKANGRRDARHHIAHLELIEPEDIPRFRDLGIIANFQPLWAFADPYIKDLTLGPLGADRSRWLYPMASILKTGAVMAAGSDWPVTSLNPIEAIQVAVTRRGPTEPEGPAWIPEEKMDLPAILAAYTINGAYLNHEEKETGSIEVGKSADLIVLDRDLFKIPPEKIHEAKVVWTLLEGREVFRALQF